MQLIELLLKISKENPNRPAVIFKDKTITFAQLKESSMRLAVGLASLGVKKSDRVALYLPNWPEYIYSYLAVWALGAVAVPLDFMLTEEELVSCISHSGARTLIAKHKANIPAENLKKHVSNLIFCHENIEGTINFEGLIAKSKDNPAQVTTADKDCAIIFYTSGTTGKPKGVLVNYRQLLAPPESMDFFVGGIKQSDKALCALPFSHLGGLIYIQNCIAHGLTFILMERFIPTEFLNNIQQHKITCFWIVPSMYYAILQLKEFETFDLSSLEWVVTFGASNSPDALRRFHQFCPKAHLLNGWGMTETNAPTVVLPRGSENIESVGRPVPWAEVKVFSAEGGPACGGDDDNPLPQGQTGEIAVKSWVVTDGYFKDPELTKATILNGWFFTGDLGKFDAQGFLYIVGRKKEMIKVAGEIVFEPEVEAAILKNPAVAEAAVIGVADKMRGEVPKAFISLKEGSSLSEEDLRSSLRQHLAHYKIPHYFEFLPALPKNRTGKVDKDRLKQG